MGEYRDVLIAWHDEPDVIYNTKVCIDKEWTEGEDDNDVFFYFQTEAELEQAKQEGDNGFEFRVLEGN
jgi:hypothetical protein